MLLSIIIPAYNEKNTVIKLIELIEQVQLPPGLTREIIVVDDGSTDGTTGILCALEGRAGIKIFYLGQNQGKTAAVNRALQEVQGDIFLMQDADLEYTPDHYLRLLEPILNGTADIVYGSRFLGDISDMKFINRAANLISRFTINLLFKSEVNDFHTGFKLFKKSVLEGITIESDRFSFDTEVTVKLIAKGHKIHELPIKYRARSRREGKKITWGLAVRAYGYMLQFWWTNLNKNSKTV